MSDPVKSETTPKPTYLSLAKDWLDNDADGEFQGYEMQVMRGLCNEIERLRTVIAGIGVQQNVILIWKLCEEALK